MHAGIWNTFLSRISRRACATLVLASTKQGPQNHPRSLLSWPARTTSSRAHVKASSDGSFLSDATSLERSPDSPPGPAASVCSPPLSHGRLALESEEGQNPRHTHTGQPSSVMGATARPWGLLAGGWSQHILRAGTVTRPG